MFFFLLGVLFSVFVYYKLIRPCSYWKEKGIPHIRSWPLVGSIGDVVFRRKHFMNISVEVYNQFFNERYAGLMIFSRQVLLVRDLDLIKQVGVKDFGNFQDHTTFVESETDPFLSKSLLNLKGAQWRDMRATLSPVFTSSKIKNMYILIGECAENFVNNFQAEVEVEMKELFSKFTTDVIATTAFGVQVDSLKEPNNEFFTMGAALTDLTLWQVIKMLVFQYRPLAKMFGIEILPKQVTSFFRAIIKDNIEKRENEGIVRPDLIHLLMEARKGKLKHESVTEVKKEGFATVEEAPPDMTTEQIELTDDHIVAQAMLFFFAGFDTVSTASTFLAYELAINPDIQKKLQEEIDAVGSKYHSKVPYDVLLSMKYLDQVLSESLRLWPPAFQTDRLCVKNFTIQPSTPDEKPFLIEKGVTVLIPITALHRDPQYYPEPSRFNPDRFNDENRSKIVPGTYLPFGIGPRNCIGSRFAILKIKTLFYHLLSKFDIVPIGKTQIPLKLDKKRFSMAPENGLWLVLKPRKKNSTLE